MQGDPRILVLETSAGVGSAALAEGSQVIAEKGFTANFQYAAQLLPTVDQLCREHHWQPGDIDQLYISIGPGSFTGLRIAVTFAKSFAYAHGIKIVAVPSTDAAALNVIDANRRESIDVKFFGVVIEAKRKQIYAAGYQRLGGDNHSNCNIDRKLCHNDRRVQDAFPVWLTLDDHFTPGLHQFLPPAVMGPKEFLDHCPRPLYLLGEGLTSHGEALAGRDIIPLPRNYWPPHASAVHQCGWVRSQAGLFVEPEQLFPLYLRRPEAVERWEKLHPPA
jgi:tRNA threonylcarbamoyl adenosine modification protein YeaZ